MNECGDHYHFDKLCEASGVNLKKGSFKVFAFHDVSIMHTQLTSLTYKFLNNCLKILLKTKVWFLLFPM